MSQMFTGPDLSTWLEAASAEELDDLRFGVIGMNLDGIVVAYNKAEAAVAGLTPARVIGRHFFTSVAPCTNNYMVAQRFELQTTLDETIDYIFTLKMSPTPVRLRLLKRPDFKRMFLLVEKR